MSPVICVLRYGGTIVHIIFLLSPKRSECEHTIKPAGRSEYETKMSRMKTEKMNFNMPQPPTRAFVAEYISTCTYSSINVLLN